MKNKIKVLLPIAFAFICTLNLNCSKDGGDAIFIPDLVATWANTTDDTNEFFFFNYTTDANTSSFEGNENSGGNQFHFTGSFTNHDIQFTYDNTADPKSGSYSGTINDASTKITLSSSTLGNLVLEKK